MATPTSILGMIGSAMLFGYDVFDMELGNRRREIGQAAVFAPALRPFANELTQRTPRHGLPGFLSDARAFA